MKKVTLDEMVVGEWYWIGNCPTLYSGLESSEYNHPCAWEQQITRDDLEEYYAGDTFYGPIPRPIENTDPTK